MVICLAAGCDRAAMPDDKPTPRAQAHAPPARDPVAEISVQMEACIGDDAPMAMRGCADEAIDAAEALTAKSAGNAQLNELYGAMFEPIMSTLTEDSGPVAYQNVIVSSYSEFALARAAILTGASRPGKPAAPTADAFARLSDGKAFAQRWGAIRDADCAAYPVTDCAARLDQAMAAMLNGLDPKNDAE